MHLGCVGPPARRRHVHVLTLSQLSYDWSNVCKNHEFRTKTKGLIPWGFHGAKDRCVMCPRRWHDDTPTDVMSSVSAASIAVSTRLQSMSLCTEPAVVPPPLLPSARPW